MPSPSGGTPLEAAARAITAKDEWGADQIGCGRGDSDCRNGHCLDCSRLVARAALTAAIDALPRNPSAPDQVWMESDSTSVLYAVSTAALRRALGLEGDQG